MGTRLGTSDAATVGTKLMDGSSLGASEDEDGMAVIEGKLLGKILGELEGMPVGLSDGILDGASDGASDGGSETLEYFTLP